MKEKERGMEQHPVLRDNQGKKAQGQTPRRGGTPGYVKL